MIAVVIFITFMFLQSLSGESSRQPDASLDLTSEAVRDGMQNWLDSVANMRIEWTAFNHEEVKAELPNLTETELEGYYFRQSFLWDKSGSFRREIFMYEKETLVYHQVLGVSGDNQLAFTVDFKCESGIPKQNKFTIKPLQQSADNNAVLPLRGWMSSHGKYWLAERAQLPKILKLDESGLVVFDQEVVRYFLDPQYSYLPARVEFRSSSSDSEPISVFKVEAFEKTPSGTPYPLNGTESIEKSGTAHWRTTKFTINEVLTSNAFEPPPPDKGVLIEDKISNKNYRADFSQWDRILEIAQRSRSNAPDRSYENTGLQVRVLKICRPVFPFVEELSLQSRVSFLATIGTLLASIAFFVADSPGGLKGGAPTINWKCRSTPAPFWTLTPCMCPVLGVPQDFCINRIPLDGSENVEVRYCEFTGDPADDCDFTQVQHCGGVVFKCLNAHCTNAPSYPLPSTWNCTITFKPYNAYCAGSMPWCDPVDY